MLNITEREAKSILAYCANLLGYDNISCNFAIFISMRPIYNCVCEKNNKQISLLYLDKDGFFSYISGKSYVEMLENMYHGKVLAISDGINIISIPNTFEKMKIQMDLDR